MSEWWVVCAALYGSVGVYLWVKVTSAVFCLMCDGKWNSAAARVDLKTKSEIRDAIDDIRDTTDPEGDGGLVRAFGVAMLSLGFTIVLALQFVKCIVAWPIVFRVGIMRRLRELLRK